jgi:hypothetical protein
MLSVIQQIIAFRKHVEANWINFIPELFGALKM